MIEIVPFSGQHLSGIVDLILTIQKSEFGIPITLDDQPDLLDIPRYYQKTNGNFWVALHGPEIIGTIALLDIGNGQGALRKMFVKKQFRGSAHGVAHCLLQVLFEWCRLHNVHEIYLGTTPAFMAAHRFYEKNGFLEIKLTELPVSFPVMSVDTKFYRYSKLYFDDLRDGEHLQCQPVEITREAIIDFGKQFDPQPFHVDENAAAGSIFGGLVASSLHTLSACTRVVVDAQRNVAILSGVGMHDVNMFTPVRPGDVLLVKAWWTELRRSRSKPDRGFASIRCMVTNQRKEPVLEYGYRYLIACKHTA